MGGPAHREKRGARPAPKILVPREPSESETLPPLRGGNQQTLRAFGVRDTDPLAAEAEKRAAREVRDLWPLGDRKLDKESIIEVGAGDTKIDLLGPRNLFHVKVTAAGANGEVDSETEYTIHMDPKQRYADVFTGPATGPATGRVVTAADLEGVTRGPGALAPFETVALYPIVLKYRRFLHLKDRDGRVCTVSVSSTVQFSYDTWQQATAGQTPSLDTVQALAGDEALTGVSIEGGGLVLQYKVIATSDAHSIGAGVGVVRAKLEERLKDAAGLPMTFIMPGETAGSQFATLEAVLRRLDEKEMERRAKLPVVDPWSGGAPAEVEEPNEGWRMPTWLGALLKAATVALAVITLVMAGAEILAAAFGISVGLATLWIVATLIGGSFVNALIARIREASATGVRNPLAVLGAALADSFGLSGIWEGITDESLLSGRKLNRSEEKRWEGGFSGLLNLGLMVFGALRSGAKPKPVDLAPEPAPAPPGEYVPRTGPDTVSAADLGGAPPPGVARSGNVRPPPHGDTYTDPFTGETYRKSDVMSRAGTQRSLRTGIDAARAEQLCYDDAVGRRNYIGLQDPGHANEAGPDSLFARRDPGSGALEIVFGDATVNRTKAPYRTPPATWVAEARLAIQRVTDPALKAQLEAAFDAGRFVVETTLVEILPDGVRFTPL
jgi:hypothetical protein